MGKSYGEILWGNRMGKSYGEIVWGNLMGFFSCTLSSYVVETGDLGVPR